MKTIYNIRIEEILIHEFSVEAESHDEALQIAGEVRSDETAGDCEACNIDTWAWDGVSPKLMFVDVDERRRRERLRDSAPDLIAALELALDVLDNQVRHYLLSDTWNDIYCASAVTEARAAIAKARGES